MTQTGRKELCIMHYALCIMHYALCIMHLLIKGHLYGSSTNDSNSYERILGLHYAIVASCNIGIIQRTQTVRKESSACIMQLLLNAISALYKWLKQLRKNPLPALCIMHYALCIMHYAISALYKWLKQLRKNPRPALCNCCLMQYWHYTNDSNS